MPGLIRPKDVISKLGKLDEKTICEMYSRLLQRAMDTNPLIEWRITVNPTREDLSKVLSVLPPSDMEEIDSIWF
jgi:hypothetical protein